jgi:hypothetical protein
MLGASTPRNPYGPPWPVIGLDLPFTTKYAFIYRLLNDKSNKKEFTELIWSLDQHSDILTVICLVMIETRIV